MADLKRQLAFLKRLVEKEYSRVKKRPGGTSSTLNGLMACERSIQKLCDLEEVSAEILLRGNGELPLQGIGTVAKLEEVDTKLFDLKYPRRRD